MCFSQDNITRWKNNGWRMDRMVLLNVRGCGGAILG